MSSDLIHIECACGYTVSIPASQLDSTEACINCGADLDKSQLRPQKPTPSASIPVPMPAKAQIARNPFEDPDEEDSFVPVADDTQEPSAFAQTPGRDVGPPKDFEGTESFVPSMHEAKETPAASAPVKETNPFEDPNEPPNSFGDDSAALASEADVPKNYSDPTPKTDPSKIRTFTDAEHKNAYRGVEKEEKCPRCGNVYRGDWDKRETVAGDMCFICSNQASDGVPLRLQTEEKKRNAEDGVLTPMAELKKRRAEIEEEKPGWIDTDSPRFKMVIAMVGVFMILFTIYMVATDDFQTYSERMAERQNGGSVEVTQEEVQSDDLPAWITAIIIGGRIFGAFLSSFLAIYLVLYTTNRLPNDDVIKDTIVILFPMVLISMMYSVIWFGRLFFDDPLMQTIFLGMFIGPLGMIAACMILMRFLDFRIRDFIYLWVFSFFANTFVWVLSMFFEWGIASIVL